MLKDLKVLADVSNTLPRPFSRQKTLFAIVNNFFLIKISIEAIINDVGVSCQSELSVLNSIRSSETKAINSVD